MSNINKKLLNLERISSTPLNNTISQEEMMRSFKSDVQNINNISRRFKYIKYLFNYTSQFYLWFAIFPFVILRILLNDYGKLIEIKKNTNLRRPHNGRLLYEKMRNLNYNNYHKIFKEFLIAK